MSKTTTYRFTFDKPVEFKRNYNFLIPSAPLNNFWLPYESSKSFLATTKSETRNTLVKTLDISPTVFYGGIRYYIITLKGEGADIFYVSKDYLAEFLKLFNLN